MSELTPTEREIALQLANLTSDAIGSTFGMLLDPELTVAAPEILPFNSAGHATSQLPVLGIVTTIPLLGALNTPYCFVLDLQPAFAISDLLMGGASAEAGTEEITDVQLNAVGEALSQMMGAAAGGLSQFTGRSVEISAPQVHEFSPAALGSLFPDYAEGAFTLIRFSLNSASLSHCKLVQVIPTELLSAQIAVVTQLQATATAASADTASGLNTQPPQEELVMSAASVGPGSTPDMADGFTDSAFMGQPGGGGAAGASQAYANPVTVQPVEFASFDHHTSAMGAPNKNLDLVMDVCLNLTVELGRSELPIKEVLELTRGSVIELNRVAGESVDLYANGKMIAKGEVVVIEDNFGLRITSIVSPADRIRGL